MYPFHHQPPHSSSSTQDERKPPPNNQNTQMPYTEQQHQQPQQQQYMYSGYGMIPPYMQQQQLPQYDNNSQITNPMLLRLFAQQKEEKQPPPPQPQQHFPHFYPNYQQQQNDYSLNGSNSPIQYPNMNQSYYYPPYYANYMYPPHMQQGPSDVREIENALRAMIFSSNNGNGNVNQQSVEEQMEEQNAVADDHQVVTHEVNEVADQNHATKLEQTGSAASNSAKKRKKRHTKSFSFGQSRESLTDEMLELPEHLVLTKEITAKISSGVQQLFKELVPTDKEIEKKDKFFKRVVDMIKWKWHDAELHLFGSSASNLCVRGFSDVDVCLIIRPPPNMNKNSAPIEVDSQSDDEEQSEEPVAPSTPQTPKSREAKNSGTPTSEKKPKTKKRVKKISEYQQFKKNYVNQLTQYLEKSHMRQVKPLFTARVPIVKFADPDTGFNCDICVNNILAVYNTRLLKAYSEMDLRCLQIIFIVKYWAKVREINQPYLGTLSSYSYTLLVIHYLQHTAPPVLPILQDEKKVEEFNVEKFMLDGLDGNTYDCTYYQGNAASKNAKKAKTFKDSLDDSFFASENTENVGKLLAGFFQYYAFTFNFSEHVVCIRKGETLTKEDKKWTNPQEQRNYMCIEDPFETDFNVARTVSEEGLKQIQYEFVRAYHLLCNKSTDLKHLVCARLSKPRV